VGQSHSCDPLMTLDERLALLDSNQRAICEALLARLPEIGDVQVEPVRVGLFLKHGSVFASLRMRRAGMRLLFMLPRPLEHPRLSYPRVRRGTTRIPHSTTLVGPKDVDDVAMSWLAESYARSDG